jgi:hypothetical protein
MDTRKNPTNNRPLSRKKELVAVIAMLAVLFVVWSPVLNNGFLTHWDDQWMVTGNPHLLEVTYLNTISTDAVATLFSEPYNGQYSPVNTLAYMGIIKAGGMEPFGFQLFFLLNIMLVLHLLPSPRAAIIADRYVYLSAIGFFLVIVFAAMRWLGEEKRPPQLYATITACVAAVRLILAGISHQRTKDWQNMDTLQQDVHHITDQHIVESPVSEEMILNCR